MVGKLQKDVRGELLVGKEENVALEMVIVLQKDMMKTIFGLVKSVEKNRREVVMELFNSVYVTGGFVPTLEVDVEQGNLIQERARYLNKLLIFGTVNFEDWKDERTPSCSCLQRWKIQ